MAQVDENAKVAACLERSTFILSQICFHQSTARKVLTMPRFHKEDPFNIRLHGAVSKSSVRRQVGSAISDTEIDRLQAFMHFYTYDLGRRALAEDLLQEEPLFLENLAYDFRRRRSRRWLAAFAVVAWIISTAALVVVALVLDNVTSLHPELDAIDETLLRIGTAQCMSVNGFVDPCGEEVMGERDCLCCFNLVTGDFTHVISCPI